MCFSVEADLVAGIALLPVGVLTLREVRRARELPFAALPLLFAVHQLTEAVVSAYLAFTMLRNGVGVTVHPHALQYRIGLPDTGLWTALYIVAGMGAAVSSGYRSIVAFGLANLVGLTVVAIVYAEAFASLWCIWAALTSLLMFAHMVRRRWFPDAERLHGRPRVAFAAG